MNLKRWIFPVDRWIEPFLAIIVLGGAIRALIYLGTHGYLPQPYFYDPNDQWMDWFNTADWARDKGVYDSWGSVYAPLTFVVIKMLGLPYCYQGGSGNSTSLYARDCDWLGAVALHTFYFINVVLIAIIYFKSDRKTVWPRAFSIAAGLPMTNSLERGNIVVIAFTCLLLAHGPLLKSARLRWIALGLAINFKIYLFASLFPQLLRRRWRWFEGALIATIAVYIISYAIYGSGTPFEIYENVISYNDGMAGQLLDIWYTATYGPLMSLLNNPNFHMDGLIGSDNVNLMLIIYPSLLIITQVTIVLAAVAAWIRPEAVPMYRLTNLGLSLALITMESGGYSQMYVIFFVFLEKWKGFGAKWAIVTCYVLCFQFDLIIDRVAPIVRDTFFGRSTEIVTYYIMAGPFVRPALFYSIPFALACATLRMVWIDIRLQGWKSRWRYRHDLPIMIGSGDVRPPL